MFKFLDKLFDFFRHETIVEDVEVQQPVREKIKYSELVKKEDEIAERQLEFKIQAGTAWAKAVAATISRLFVEKLHNNSERVVSAYIDRDVLGYGSPIVSMLKIVKDTVSQEFDEIDRPYITFRVKQMPKEERSRTQYVELKIEMFFHTPLGNREHPVVFFDEDGEYVNRLSLVRGDINEGEKW